MQVIVSHVFKKYEESQDITALVDVSFKIDSETHMVAVLGHNGAGKSTLLNLLGAIDTPDSGSIIVDKKDITLLDRNELAAFRLHDIGMVFQFCNLLSTFTIYENIAMPCYLAGCKRKIIKKKIAAISERVGIKHLLSKYPYEVSGGEAQRAAIARSLMNDPKLLLADEPTGNLDTKNAQNIYILLHELAKEEKLTVILVTHDDRMVKYADQTIRMENGRIME